MRRNTQQNVECCCCKHILAYLNTDIWCISPPYKSLHCAFRSNLKKLIYDMLTCTYVKEDLVKILVQTLEIVDPNINSRFQFLAEIVSEVHEPMTEVSVEQPAEEKRKKQLMVGKECYTYVTFALESLRFAWMFWFCLKQKIRGEFMRRTARWQWARYLHFSQHWSFDHCQKQISVNGGVTCSETIARDGNCSFQRFHPFVKFETIQIYVWLHIIVNTSRTGNLNI